METRAFMNKVVIIFLLSFFLLSCAFSQPKTDYNRPDAIARATPDSVEKSIAALSGYFMANLHSEKELIRAVYYWTANGIAYDIDNILTFRPAEDPATLIMQTLRERKAVCQGYSALFHELCENVGIESYVVMGYTKQNGSVMNLNHAWVVARIDTGWYFFDPTWGSGFIMNGRFTRKFTNEYFMVKPEIFIKTHMPFDPLWQCLYYPFSSGNFYKAIPPPGEPGNFFNFPDSIGVYNQLAKTEKQAAALHRLEKNGVVNNSILEYQHYLRQSLEVDRINQQNELQNRKITQFNTAVNHFNTASILFNEYIDYWNRQFKPARPDAAIRKMIDTCNYHLAQSRKILEELIPQEETLIQNKETLLKAIRENQKRADDQSAFLTDYFNTSRAFRGTLFRKYTWLGVPVK